MYVSGLDRGVPGFADTPITENLQHLLAAGRHHPSLGLPSQQNFGTIGS